MPRCPRCACVVAGSPAACPRCSGLTTGAQQADPPVHSLVAAATLIRRFEEGALRLWSEGHVAGALHTCIGQEGPAVGVTWWLGDDDAVVSTHRGHGHFLARTGDVEGLMAELLGRTSGVCQGRGGSQHLCDPARGFFANGIVGGGLPGAAGMALAEALAAAPGIAVAFIGDGALGQGVVYETLNIASLWSLPLLVVVEANGWAQSTPTVHAVAGSFAARAAAFDIASSDCQVASLADAWRAGGDAVAQVRESRRPFVLTLRTHRLGPHSKGDHQEVISALARNPAQDALAADCGHLTEDEMAAVEAAVRGRLAGAVEAALAAPRAGLAS